MAINRQIQQAQTRILREMDKRAREIREKQRAERMATVTALENNLTKPLKERFAVVQDHLEGLGIPAESRVDFQMDPKTYIPASATLRVQIELPIETLEKLIREGRIK